MVLMAGMAKGVGGNLVALHTPRGEINTEGAYRGLKVPSSNMNRFKNY